MTTSTRDAATRARTRTSPARRGRAAAIALAAAAASLAAASGAAAQDYKSGAGYYAGAVWFSDFNSGANPSGGGLAEELHLDPGWIVGLQAEHWFTGRLGARLNTAFSERPLDIGADERDIGLWMLDGNLLLRLLPADPARVFNMFISAGAGLLRYKFGDGDIITVPGADARFDGDDSAGFVVTGGLGFDFLTSWTWDDSPIGVRFEAADHMMLDSPFESISGDSFSPVHNVRFTLGLFTGFGLLR